MNYNMTEVFKNVSALLKAVEIHVHQDFMTQEFQDSFMSVSDLEDRFLGGEQTEQEKVFKQLENFIMAIEKDVKQIPKELQEAINEIDDLLNDYFYDKLKIKQNDILFFNKEHKRI